MLEDSRLLRKRNGDLYLICNISVSNKELWEFAPVSAFTRARFLNESADFRHSKVCALLRSRSLPILQEFFADPFEVTQSTLIEWIISALGKGVGGLLTFTPPGS